MKYSYKLVFFTFIFIASILNSVAQLYVGDRLLRDSSEYFLSFRFENTNFIKDNEFSSDLTYNATHIGFFAKPSLEYYLTNDTRVKAGIFLLKYSGLNNFTQAIPIFSVQQKLNKHLDLVMGSLYGTSYHNLSEPIFRIDNYFTDNVEYGAQFIYHSKYFDSDLWISWEKFIFVGDPYQEKFHVGWSSEFKYDINSLSVSVPIQLYTFHQGGTIDLSTAPVYSLFNGASGLKIRYNINKTTSLSFEPMIYLYNALSSPDSGLYSLKITDGNALYLNLKFNSKYFDARVGYWYATNFVAPSGEYLFQSLSIKDPNYYSKYRKIIPFKVILKYPVNKYIKIQLRTDEYYNISDGVFDNSFSLFLIVNQDIFISRIKNNRPNK